ncbi:MAG TPA: hypothetical protein VMF90_18675 [Rhizobiaceae bacterium]|nr:hypothetical protein [Rhizobiaceae bacterium]
MSRYRFRAVAAALAVAAVAKPISSLASDNPAFDEACKNYYGQENDPSVPLGNASQFCDCLTSYYASVDLGTEALDFFARTYSDDLTTFMHDYPEGETWMNRSFEAETTCKAG